MSNFLGRSDNHLLFADGDHAVIVDARVSVITASGATEEFKALKDWGDGEYSEANLNTADAALADLANPLPETTGRMYTVPRGVQAAAKSALKELDRSGRSASRTSLYVGGILASGGQIPFNELANVSAYFDRKGEQNFDGTFSDEEISWRLHGGDSARKWAKTIVDREAAPAVPHVSVEEFSELLKNDPEAGPEFIARVGLNGEGIDRLYRVDIDNRTFVWDEASWNDLGHADWDIWKYDEALDANNEASYSTHVIVDPESAIQIASEFANGTPRIYVEDLNLNEASMVREAIPEIDWEFIDSTITAAGVNPNDNIYSEEERSKNASAQLRDATGKFANTGDRVMIDGNPRATGTISRINPEDGTVEVSMESGGSRIVPANTVQAPGEQKPIPGRVPQMDKVDFSGILAEPRTPINRTQAQIPGTLPRMTADDLHHVINNFPAWVKKQRESFAPLPNHKKQPVQRKGSTHTGSDLNLDAYQHPLIAEWLKRKDRNGHSNSVWYDPILSAAVAPPKPGKTLTPETSDVQPVYMAVVSPDDPRAVFQLISLVPASSTSTQPMVYSREQGKWVADQQALNDLKSATPPPVVPLDSESLDDVLKQVDESQGAAEALEQEAKETEQPQEEQAAPTEFALHVLWGPRSEFMEAVVAAGGMDRNRGGAEKLRKYWTVGPGGAKIAWGTPGDWTRCVRNLGKYLGARADGYCALRHKEMTKMWTGDKEHRKAFSSNLYGTTYSDDSVESEAAIIDKAIMRATAADAKDRVRSITASATPHFHAGPYKDWRSIPEQAITAAAGDGRVGGAFFIPLALPEGIFSGDGRLVEKYAATVRNLPISLLWQVQTAKGHDGSFVVGRIERLGRTPLGIGGGYGHFDVGPWGREAERMVRNGMLRFVSADMDEFEAEIDTPAEASENDDKTIKNNKTIIKGARVMAVTIVAKPAFQEATIQMVPDLVIQEEDLYPDGIWAEEPDPIEAAALVASASIAEHIPVVPPRAWFNNPSLTGPTPLTVTDDGRVFGHVAAWNTGHINPNLGGINPPKSKSGYAYFHSGVLRTDDGTDIPVGQLTLAGGHAGLHASAAEAVRHYDDTGSAVADVHAGEDEFGIWVSGALRPGTTPEQVRALRASAPSGDWRPIRGNHELVAVCQVNVPGFPIARTLVASGQMTAIVAAGAATLAKLKQDPLSEVTARLEALEQFSARELSNRAEELAARIKPVKDAHVAELSARSESLLARMETFGYVPKKSREEAAEKGQALPDGSYPIRNVSDLKNAIRAYGRANESDRAKVRRHIMKRARALGHADLIPEEWKTAQSEAITASLVSMRERIEAGQAALTAAAEQLSEEEKRRLRAEGEEVPAPKGGEVPVEEAEDQKYKPGYQPRDYNGQFRDVLARLKENLGHSGNQKVVEKIKETDAKADTGDYATAVKAGLDLKSALDRLDAGALNAEAIGSVRAASRELGKVIANLPLPFENQAAKVRFSDLPPTLRDLIDDFIARVEDKIGAEDAAAAVQKLKSFKSGSDLFSQSDISKEMSKLLRLLT